MITANVLPPDRQINPVKTSDDFMALKSVVERHAKIAFRYLSPADREEAVAEAVAAAFQSFVSLTRRSKDPFRFPSMIATRAVQHVQNDRRVGSKLNSRDVFSRLASQRKGFQLQSLFRAEGEWTEALVDNRQTPIPDQVSFRCDFPRWLQTLRPRDRRLVDLLAMGHSTASTARRFGLSPARISQLRRELHQWWQVFHGELVRNGPSLTIEVA
jgi:DNA-directed RNA polymerase specialized sigma24 family protein